MSIHPTAESGFSVAAADYEKGRPDYPDAAVRHLCAALAIGPGATVLDLAAGTGKLTALLAPTGAHLIAVEPVQAMRAALAAKLPQVDCRPGTAEAIPLADAEVDAVVVAQAFHWFDAPRAAAEIARVLRPGGGLAMLWNRRDESVDWVARLTAIGEAHAGAAPRYRSGQWGAAFDGSTLFAPVEHAQFRHVQVGDAAMVVARIVSISFIAALPEPQKREIASQIERARPPGDPLPYRRLHHASRAVSCGGFCLPFMSAASTPSPHRRGPASARSGGAPSSGSRTGSCRTSAGCGSSRCRGRSRRSRRPRSCGPSPFGWR
jgi:SAM-dependent methyltransferase